MVKRYEPSCMHSNLYEEHGQGMFVLHEDYEKLRVAVVTLRRAQRAYLADRGNEELGAAVARAAAYVDELLHD